MARRVFLSFVAEDLNLVNLFRGQANLSTLNPNVPLRRFIVFLVS